MAENNSFLLSQSDPRELSMETKQSQIFRIGNRVFKLFISKDQIEHRINALGNELAAEYQDKYPLFIVVLNGAFMFAADIIRACHFECEIQFVKLASYQGLNSSGTVKQLIGLQQSTEGRHVIIVEDIVDTGRTMDSIMTDLSHSKPASLSIATLLLKPDCLEFEFESTYVGFEIPDAFVIGYGLDLDGKARNLPDIYQLDPNG